MSFKDITGKHFGKLVAQWPVGRKKDAVAWLCLCDCGNLTVVKGSVLRHNLTRSCGCLQKEAAKNLCLSRTKHGATKKISKVRNEYDAWSAMKGRCFNPNLKNYQNYGGRGIKICDRWIGLNGFINFFNDMGLRPEGMSLDRIDVNGNYEPSNCRWATRSEQSLNRRKRLAIQNYSDTDLLLEIKRRKLI